MSRWELVATCQLSELNTTVTLEQNVPPPLPPRVAASASRQRERSFRYCSSQNCCLDVTTCETGSTLARLLLSTVTVLTLKPVIPTQKVVQQVFVAVQCMEES